MPNPNNSTDKDQPKTERVSKLIARAGLASRRAAEDIIAAGRVAVNGHFITEQGVKADPNADKITVDGTALKFDDRPPIVVVLHKPKYTITTRDDPENRPTVFDLLPHAYGNLHPVGRLDFETSGVLLLSDDGDLTHLLTHPSHGVEKIYEARVRGEVSKDTLALLERGVRLEDGMTAPCRARVLAQREKNALLEITLREGRNRQARRMLESVSHAASSLRRVSFAGVELEGMSPGEHRELFPAEVKKLRRVAEMGLKSKSRPRSRPKPHPRPSLDEDELAKPDAKPQPHARMSRTNNSRARNVRENRDEDNRGGETRGSANRGGDNRGDVSRSGDNRGSANRDGISRDGANRSGTNRNGDNRGGVNRSSANRDGDNRGGDNRNGDNRGGVNRSGDNRDGENRNNPNRDGASRDDYNRSGVNRNGASRSGTNRGGASRDGADRNVANRGGASRDNAGRDNASREGEQTPLARRIQRKWK